MHEFAYHTIAFPVSSAGGLFDRTTPGTGYQRVVTQLSWLGTIAREGALFDVIGQRT